jgi:tRNA(adenine34) deaminase
MIETHMRRAVDLAAQALERGELPIGAVVVLGEEILAEGTTTECEEGRYLVHAELNCLLKADALKPFPGRRRDVCLVTNVEPCLMCMGAAMSFFLGEVHFGVESPTDGAVELARLWVKDGGHLPGYRFPRVQGGLLREETLALFREYTRQTDPSNPMWKWADSIATLS